MKRTTIETLSADLHYEGQSVMLMKAKADLFEELLQVTQMLAGESIRASDIIARHMVANNEQSDAELRLAIQQIDQVLYKVVKPTLTKANQLTKGELNGTS